jgi:membrane associated rhomboid family serine protease
MLPLRDDIPSSRFPVVTLGLIVLNAFVFIQELMLGPQLEEALFTWALVPARYTDGSIVSQSSLLGLIVPFFSSMFLHGGWIHLIGNMWILWIFGDNVEDRVGHGKFLLLYLLSGVAAAVLHIATNASSAIPTIGASGAVAGVMGAYLRYFPHARVHTVIPPFIWGPIFDLPAVIFLGWWLLLQFFNGALSLAAKGDYGGVAWWAHVGGFIFGMLVAGRRKAQPRPRYQDEAPYWG